MATQQWVFSSRFRRHAFGWKSDLPIKRIKEAISEIKAVARKDPVLAAEEAVRQGVDPRLVAAVMHTESNGNPTARSKAGAYGPMQLMPGTARRFGVRDSRDPAQNISGGARYLSYLLEFFKNDIVHPAAGLNQRGGQNGDAASLFHLSGGAEKLLGFVKCGRVQSARQGSAGRRDHQIVCPGQPGDAVQ